MPSLCRLLMKLQAQVNSGRRGLLCVTVWALCRGSGTDMRSLYQVEKMLGINSLWNYAVLEKNNLDFIPECTWRNLKLHRRI